MTIVTLDRRNVSSDEIMRFVEKLVQGEEANLLILENIESRGSEFVSVIVRTFNSAMYLHEALNSIINQAYDGPLEILLSYDRGTTDSTLEILLAFLSVVDRNNVIVKVLFHNNTSPFRDVELALNYAEGRFITFLDYDNVFMINKISEQKNFMLNNGSVFSFSSVALIGQNGKVSSEPYVRVPNNYQDLATLLTGNYVDINTIMIEKSFIRAVLIPMLSQISESYFDWIFEDYLFGILGSATKNLDFFDKILVGYRIHDSNLSAIAPKTSTTLDGKISAFI